MNNTKFVKILIPILIVAVIGGIWFVKNKPAADKAEAKKEGTKVETEAKTSEKAEDGAKADSSDKANQTADNKEAEKEDGKTVDTGLDFTFEFTEALNFDELKKHGLPIIADYGSERCGPCVMMHPDLEAIHEAYEGKAFIKYTDVWKSSESTANVPVRVTPTQVLFTADGKPYVPSEDILSRFGETSFTRYNDKNSGEHVLTVHEGMLNQDQMRELLAEMGVKE